MTSPPIKGLRPFHVCALALAILLCIGCRPDTFSERPTGALLETGQVIVFLGDSITEQGSRDGGFVQIVSERLNHSYRNFGVTIINKGVSGDQVGDLLARLDRDVLFDQPDWVVISIGINDVWKRMQRPTEAQANLRHYAEKLDALVARLQGKGIRVALCTTTVISENLRAESNVLLAAYNDAVRDVARKRTCLLIHVSRTFIQALADLHARDAFEPRYLTRDGVHLSSAGNRLFALAVLNAFGFRESVPADEVKRDPLFAKAYK